MQRAMDRAVELYRNAPTAFPDVSNLNPDAFDRWSLKTPERWVDPATLERDAEGRVKVGGDTVMIWRYFVAVYAALVMTHNSSSE